MSEDAPEDPADNPTERPSVRDARLERALGVALGLSSLSWAILGALHDGGPPLVARIGASLVNATVGALFLVREPARRHGSARDIGAALPSMSLGLFSWWLSGPSWPEPLPWLFLALAVLAVGALTQLGRSFAIFAARRSLKQRGPYAVVRHPLYAVELLLVALPAFAYAWWAAVGLTLLGALLMIPRMAAEERILASDPDYAAYAARVRYRLVPGLY